MLAPEYHGRVKGPYLSHRKNGRRNTGQTNYDKCRKQEPNAKIDWDPQFFDHASRRYHECCAGGISGYGANAGLSENRFVDVLVCSAHSLESAVLFQVLHGVGVN